MNQEKERKIYRDVPVKPQYGTTTLSRHKFIYDKDGKIDNFILDYEYHNGPKCIRCGESFCEHCNPEKYEEPCTAEGFICPTCKDIVDGGDNFCRNCGQSLMWSSD